MSRLTRRLPLCLTALVIFGNISSYCQSSKVNKGDDRVHVTMHHQGFDASKHDLSKLPVLDLNSEHSTKYYDQRELKRSKSYDGILKGRPPLLGDDNSENIPPDMLVDQIKHEPLPVDLSDTILTAKVVSAATHITPSRTSVYSVYTVQPIQTLLGTVQQGLLLEIERGGGLIKFPTGRVITSGPIGEGIPEVGHTYLFFLLHVKSKVSPFIVTAFELTDAGLTYPMDTGESFDIYYGAYKGVPTSTLLRDLTVALAAKESR